MAAGDFYRRLSYNFEATAAGQRPVNPHLLVQIALDATSGDAPAGGITLVEARAMLQVDIDVNQTAEFNDLVATIQNVASAEPNDDLKRLRKLEAIMAVMGIGHAAQFRLARAPDNPYSRNPQAVWARVKELLGNTRYAGVAGLVGTLAAPVWPGG